MTKDELERIISVTVTTTPSGEDIMKPLVLAGYQAALTEVMAIVEDCDGDLDFVIFKIKQLTQALAEGRKG